ncbi:MAG: poly(3-hydroxybutyrate) depolymerase [Pseudomonadota bacterium]
MQLTVYTGAVVDKTCAGRRSENFLDVKKKRGELAYALRGPTNFDAEIRHPLLAVFPPAGMDARQSEQFAKLTAPATARGFLLLYPGHERLSLTHIDQLAALVEKTVADWCIDEARIFFTGHSDGGTVAHVLAQRADWAIKVRAIAASAAGIAAQGLQDLGCNKQLDVMVMHNADDKLFPGFGRDAANWWHQCNQCSERVDRTGDGCETFQECQNETRVSYCESTGGHRRWGQDREQILSFLQGKSH